MRRARLLLTGLVLLGIGVTVSADAQPLGRDTQTSSSCQIGNIKKGASGKQCDLAAWRDGDVALLTAGPLLDVPDLARTGRLGVAAQRLGVGGHGHADAEQNKTGQEKAGTPHDDDASRIKVGGATAGKGDRLLFFLRGQPSNCPSLTGRAMKSSLSPFPFSRDRLTAY